MHTNRMTCKDIHIEHLYIYISNILSIYFCMEFIVGECKYFPDTYHIVPTKHTGLGNVLLIPRHHHASRSERSRGHIQVLLLLYTRFGLQRLHYVRSLEPGLELFAPYSTHALDEFLYVGVCKCVDECVFVPFCYTRGDTQLEV